MVFGIDLLHKMTGKNKRIVLGVVATTNKTMTKYWSTCKNIPEGVSMP